MTVVEHEIYFTPPTSPTSADSIAMEMVPDGLVIRPSFSRRDSASRRSIWPSLSPLQTSGEYLLSKFDSLLGGATSNTHLASPLSSSSPSSASTGALKPLAMDSDQLSRSSPCFVHSHLDQGALADRLHKRRGEAPGMDLGVARSLKQNKQYGHCGPVPIAPYAECAIPQEWEEDAAHSVPRKLAQTAVGVRELSRQLG